MKYVTLTLVLLALYACSPNPSYVPPAQTPAQQELTHLDNGTIRSPSAPSLTGECTTERPCVWTPPPATPPPALVMTLGVPAREIVRVDPDGHIFINGRKVSTDAQYRAAIKAILLGAMGCTNEKQLEDAANGH